MTVGVSPLQNSMQRPVMGKPCRRQMSIRKRFRPNPAGSAARFRNPPVDPLQSLPRTLAMKTHSALAIAAFGLFTTLAASPAFADEATYEYPTTVTSSLSRADVRAETVKARSAGLIVQGEQSIVVADTGPALSRAQVVAETLEAIRIGAIDRHEASVTLTTAQLESIRLAGQKAAASTMASL
jgi:hypothetical protein